VEPSHVPNRISTRSPLSPEELELIRRKIESIDDIGAVDDGIRRIVAHNWPDLLAKASAGRRLMWRARQGLHTMHR